MEETIDGKVYKVGSAEWAEAKNKQAQAALGRADAAEKKAEAEKKRADTAEKALAEAKDPKKATAEITKRVRLVLDCKRVAASAGVKFDDEAAAGASESDLIAEAIKLLDPSFDPAGKSPDYIAGYFASLTKGLAPAGEETPEDAEDPNTPPGDPNQPPAVPPKTDGKDKRSIFDARRGDQGRTDAAKGGGPDPDKARADMLDKQKNRWKQPLAASKTKG